jgi:orotate phosphoribosyltransferase
MVAVTGQDRLAQEFVEFAVRSGVLRFGEFKTKAGRLSPYFFNAGLFDDGEKLGRLARFYAERIVASGVEFDMLFGPAYKGIPLAAAVAIELARLGRNVPYAYNRKEAKDHGEGGDTIGAPLAGRVLIIDDVLTAGTAVRESLGIIRARGATPAGLAIALDRMERGQGEASAIRELEEHHAIRVVTIASLDDLTGWLQGRPGMQQDLQAIDEYRQLYGAANHA